MAEETDGSPGFSEGGPGFWSVLQHLQHMSQLCDVQLCVSHPDDPLTSDAIPAHKVVLVACSSFFRVALETSELLDVYNFVGISRENLQVVVDYMYRRVTLHELMSNTEAAFAAQSIQVIAHGEEGGDVSGNLVPDADTEEGNPADEVSTHSSLDQRPETGAGDEEYLDSPQTDPVQDTESSVVREVEERVGEMGKDSHSGKDHDSAQQTHEHLDTSTTMTVAKTEQCAASQDLKQTGLASKGSTIKKVSRNPKDTGRRAAVKSQQRLSVLSNSRIETTRTSLGRSSQRRRKSMNYKLMAEGIDPTDEDQTEMSVDVPSDFSVDHLEHCKDNFKDPDFSANIGPPKRKRGRPPKVPAIQSVMVISEAEDGGSFSLITRPVFSGNPDTTEAQGENNMAGECHQTAINDDNADEEEQTDQLQGETGAASENTNTENIVMEGAKKARVDRPPAVGSLQCMNCNRAFNTEFSLTQHRKLVHGVQVLYGCTTCGKELDTMRLLEKHKKDDHQMALYSCATCGTNFKTRDGLKLHQQKKHSGEKPTFPCTVCLKSFYLKGELKNHLQYHSTERTHQCDQCSRAFKSKSILVRHVNTFHSNERKFQCDVCGTMFKTRNDCKAHRLKHFRKKNPLSDERKPGKRLPERQQYPCTQCGKVFKKRAHQLVHENLQHRQKNDGTAYLCTVCNKVFSIRHYLMQHIKNCHSNRRFTCSQCSQNFSQRGDLKKHESIPGRCKGSVAEPKPFSCPYCNRGFSLKGNLSKHLQHPERCRHHPSNPSNPEVIVVLQQEAEGDGEAAAHGETHGEAVVVVPAEQQADRQGLEAACVKMEEGAVTGPSSLYSLSQDGNLELQGLVDGKVVPISMSAVDGQYQFHLQEGQLSDGQVVTYQVAAEGDGQGSTNQVQEGLQGGTTQVQEGSDGQVVTYQVAGEGHGQGGQVKEVSDGQVVMYQIPGRDNEVAQEVMEAHVADNTQIIHLFENGTISHNHHVDTQDMEVVEGHQEVIMTQGHSEVILSQGQQEVIQSQGHSEVIQGQGHLQIIQGRVVQTQDHPEVIQVQGHPEICQGQGHPEVIQVHGHPDDIQSQGHLQMIQGEAMTQGHSEILHGNLEVISGHEVREEVVTEMGMDIQTIEGLTEVSQEVIEVTDSLTEVTQDVVHVEDPSMRQEVVLGSELTEGVQEVVQVLHDMTHVTQQVVTDDMTQLTQEVVYMEHSEDIVTEQLLVE